MRFIFSEYTDGLLFTLAVFLGIITKYKAIRQYRAILKHRENDCLELSSEELSSRVAESEIMYVELEKTYWTHIGIFIGMATYFYSNNHLIAIPVAIFFIGIQFLSIKPFTLGTSNK